MRMLVQISGAGSRKYVRPADAGLQRKPAGTVPGRIPENRGDACGIVS